MENQKLQNNLNNSPGEKEKLVDQFNKVIQTSHLGQEQIELMSKKTQERIDYLKNSKKVNVSQNSSQFYKQFSEDTPKEFTNLDVSI